MFVELGDYLLHLKQITHIKANAIGDKIQLLVSLTSGETIQIVLDRDKAVRFINDLRTGREKCLKEVLKEDGHV